MYLGIHVFLESCDFLKELKQTLYTSITYLSNIYKQPDKIIQWTVKQKGIGYLLRNYANGMVWFDVILHDVKQCDMMW